MKFLLQSKSTLILPLLLKHSGLPKVKVRFEVDLPGILPKCSQISTVGENIIATTKKQKK